MIKRVWKSYGKPCLQCGGPNDPYMITFKLWKKITKPRERLKYLCLECVEQRLDRRLKLEDFLDAPINFEVHNFDCRKFVKEKRCKK